MITGDFPELKETSYNEWESFSKPGYLRQKGQSLLLHLSKFEELMNGANNLVICPELLTGGDCARKSSSAEMGRL